MSSSIVNRPYHPALLLAPGFSRDRDGAVIPTLSDSVVTNGDAWLLRKGFEDSVVAFVAPTGSFKGDGTPITPTLSGSVREVPFDGGVGWMVEEGTTNLVARPMTQSTTGWGGWGAGTATWVDGAIRVQNASGQLASISIYPGTTNRPAVTGGLVYTAQMTITNEHTEPRNFRFAVWQHDAGNTLLDNDPTPGPVTLGAGETRRFVRTFTALPTATSVMPSVTKQTATGVESYLASKPQVEQKAYATSFASGDMGAGYSWAGTAHASASIRARSRVQALTAGDIPISTGSVYSRMMPSADIVGRNTYLMSIGPSGSTKNVCTYISTNGLNNGRASTLNMAPGGTAPRGVVLNQYMEWDGADVAFDYRDGAGKRYVTATYDHNTPWNGDLALGDSGHTADANALPTNGPVAALILFDRPLTPEELDYLDSIPTAELQWHVAGTVSAPLDTAPETVMVRTIQDGTLVTHEMVIDTDNSTPGKTVYKVKGVSV